MKTILRIIASVWANKQQDHIPGYYDRFGEPDYSANPNKS